MTAEQWAAFLDAFKVWYHDNGSCYDNQAQAMGDYVGSILFGMSECSHEELGPLVDFKAHAHSQIGQWLDYYPLPKDYLTIHGSKSLSEVLSSLKGEVQSDQSGSWCVEHNRKLDADGSCYYCLMVSRAEEDGQ